MKMSLWISLITLFILKEGSAYPVGAPPSACVFGFPDHGAEKQLGPSPFALWVNQSTYKPSDIITVVVSSPVGRHFKGLLLRAHRARATIGRLAGDFIQAPHDIQTISWFPEQFSPEAKTCVTHNDSSYKGTVKLEWQAPSSGIGNIQFSLTVVEELKTIWADITVLVKSSEANFTFLQNQYDLNNTLDKRLHWSECGEDRGCVLYPDWCSGSDCEYGVTYKLLDDGKHVEFEVMGGKDEYVAVGLSEDALMGGTDSGTVCILKNNGKASLQHGQMPNHTFIPYPPVHYKNIQIQRIDSKLYCRFIRPVNISSGEIPSEIDYNQLFYIFIAVGDTYKSSALIKKHDALPFVTTSKTSIKKAEIIRAKSLPTRYRAHGALAVIAWLCLIPMGSMLPRHHKLITNRKIFKKMAWFPVHIFLNVLGATLSVAALIIPFFNFKHWQEITAVGVHALLAWFNFGFMALQILVGFIRPYIPPKLRQRFKTFHQIGAIICYGLAFGTIVIGFTYDRIPGQSGERILIAFILTIAVFPLWEIASYASKYISCSCSCFKPNKVGDNQILEENPTTTARTKKKILGKPVLLALGSTAVIVGTAITVAFTVRI